MTLRESIKNAASVSATVPVADAERAFKRLKKRKHNKVMPWASGRKPARRKKEAAHELPYGELRRSRLRRLFLAKKRSYHGGTKQADYNYGDLGTTGPGENPAAGVYNRLVDYALDTFKPSGNIAGTIGNHFGRLKGIMDQQRAQSTPAPQDPARLGNAWSNPGEYADAVLGQYNSQSGWGKARNALTAGAQGATMFVSGPAAGASKGMKALNVGARVGGHGAASQLSGSGPSFEQMALAVPATYAANIRDRADAHGMNFESFNKLVGAGLSDQAKRIYPDLHRRWSQGARGSELMPWWLR